MELTQAELDKKMNQRLDKLMQSRDFEKVVKKIVADCFVEFHKMFWNNRYFLKNQLN